MKRVTIIGGHGNMGRRYRTILDDLGVKTKLVDIGTVEVANQETDGFIVATPTPTHGEILRDLVEIGAPVLCEKPLSTDLAEVRSIARLYKEHDVPLSLVLQYAELVQPANRGELSYYDYWNHGKDGLVWDCFQVIVLANGPVALSERSPVWRAMINGHRLSLADMDTAYWKMLARWIINPREQHADKILEMHEKVERLRREMGYAAK